MRFLTIAAGLSLGVLGACAPETQSDGEEVIAQETPDLTEPTDLRGPQELSAIPRAFHGVWDMEPDPCEGWSDMRLTISAELVEYYESAGEVTAVTLIDAQTIAVELAMSGEGDSWTDEETFTLVEAGTQLDSVRPYPDGNVEVRRHRCP